MPPNIARPIVEFRRFVGGLNEARAEHYLNLPHSRVTDEAEFKRLQAHLVRYYEGVEPVHSFLDSAGKVFDCLPIEQQISLRGVAGPLPRAPHLPGADEPPAGPIDPIGMPAVQLHERFTDLLGNQMLAPEGTIPVQRLTLADAARFRDLTGFLDREPPEQAPGQAAPGQAAPVQAAPVQAPVQPAGAPAQGAAPAGAVAGERHQHSGADQRVDNIGGGATLNIWRPDVTGQNQMMSLGQVWFEAQPDADKQTVEAGWQVNPWRYGHTRPLLFTFWTADKYKTTGCYNLTCKGFVQTSGAWMLGGAFPLWSTANGPQVEIRLSYLLHEGRWWLFVDDDPLGYFPTTIFNGGALAQNASRIVFGGETATSDRGDWPPMGSGQLTSPVWGEIAYARRIRYFPLAGRSRNAKLQKLVVLERCYASAVVKYNAPWSETVWYGGAGGDLCG